MFFSTIVFSVAFAFASAQVSPPLVATGSLDLGSTCEETAQCANGAQCFGSTASTVKTCGPFNAACTNDAQCTTNTCETGTCSGFLEQSLWIATATPTISSTSSSASPAHPVLSLLAPSAKRLQNVLAEHSAGRPSPGLSKHAVVSMPFALLTPSALTIGAEGDSAMGFSNPHSITPALHPRHQGRLVVSSLAVHH